MNVIRFTARVLACCLAAASVASAQTAQTVDLGSMAGRRVIDGTVAGARAGAWLHIGDLTGDFYGKELIVGVPGDSGSRGAVRLFDGRPRTPVDMTTANADSVVTGGATGDRFGTAVDAGFVTQPEVVVVNGTPVGATPPRDLVVGAPGAQGGRGVVYIFAGPFARGSSRTPANAAFQIIGAPGDALGTIIETADLNGDGYREVILAVPARRLIYMVDVHRAPASTIDIAAGFPGSVISGLSGGDIALASGDVTDDGQFDLAIGDPNFTDIGGPERGAVFLIKGGAALPATINLTTQADAILRGLNSNDHAGQSLWIADLDDDGNDGRELIIGAPDGDGPADGRPNSGEVYVVWGRKALPREMTPDLILYGAASGHRLGWRVTAGDITRDQPDDIAMLAPGANGGNGEVFVYFGRHSYEFPRSPIDLASSASRRIVSDEANGPIETVRVWEVTGEGAEEIILGVPGALSAAGRLYVALSPRLDLSTTAVSLRAVQCAPASQEIEIQNPSAIAVPWRLYNPPAWVRASPATGATVVGTPGRFRLVADTAGLAPGNYSERVEVLSHSPEVVHSAAVTLELTVDPPSPFRPNANVDFNGDGCGDTAGFRPSTGTWHVPGQSQRQLGARGDIPVPGDYDGDLRADLAAYRPSSGEWLFAGSTVRLGAAGDWPIPADYDGDGRTDIAVFSPNTATWSVQGQAPVQWGQRGDVPVPADYDGDGRADMAVYRRATGAWVIRGGATVQWGGGYELPVPADYDGDGRDDIAVYNRARGTWRIRDQFTRQLGSDGDLPVPLDADRDGRADLVVFQRSSGRWLVHSPATQLTLAIDGGARGDMPAFLRPYLIFGATTDFTADGWTDLVWQHDDGRLAVWAMNGTTLERGIVLDSRVSDGSWRVSGTSDFNRDGQPDVVWQHADGRVVIWLMNGTTLIQGILVTRASDTQWRIAATGDLDGDGHADIIWQHPTGWVAAWLMNGTALARGVMVTPEPISDPGWVLAAAGDADGDGKLDLFWHHRTAGHVVVWIMNGTTLVAGRLSPTNVQDQNWKIVGAADVNGDGQPDLLWQHQNGYAVAWLMEGERLMRGAALMQGVPSDNRWRLTGPR